MLSSRKLLVAARVATAIFVSAAVAAGVLVAAPAAYAGSDDYPSQWKKPARDSMFDSWGEYNRECTSWVAWRLHGHNHFEMPFHANADDWGAKAKKLGYTVNMQPAVGAVAWWDTSTRSHVAWVEAVNPNATVEIEEYNIGGSGKYDQTTIPSQSVSGYIHFQDLATNFADGAYVTYGNDVYRMAGGAPVFVSSWAAFGKKPSGLATAKQWAALKRIPKDGTFIEGATSKKIYRMVGGAPIYISDWALVGGKQAAVEVPDATIAAAIVTASTKPNHFDHLSWYPSGTTEFVQASPSKKIYQIVGKAAVPVADWSAFGGVAQPTVQVGDDDIVNAGAASTSPYSHLLGWSNMPTPVITGVVKLKHTLTASLGIWDAKGFKLTYQWFRNGVRLPSVHTSTYTPHYATGIGKTITVKVTATRLNYVTQTLTSAATIAIPKK